MSEKCSKAPSHLLDFVGVLGDTIVHKCIHCSWLRYQTNPKPIVITPPSETVWKEPES